MVEKQINNGRDDFLIPLKDLKLKKEAVKEAKKKIFILAGEIVPER